ncbi:MAG: hydrogenase expression/formation protein HypE [Desulfobacteraceae bacterium]|jgi:hydrogenase expression/formation protein HypE
MTTERILLDHGSGGKMSHDLTAELLLPLFANPLLSPLNDGAIFSVKESKLAFSTDSFTVDPLFFPGGNIGELAVYGTVNDLSMCGAVPQYLSMAMIIEEGFLVSDLKKILNSMRTALDRAGVILVTGDTKVTPKGSIDRIFINTSGIGTIPQGVKIAADQARIGDQIIINGDIADHGITIMTQREGLHFDSNLKSDTAPLNHLVAKMLAVDHKIHVLRDPTRGGVGTALNEIAHQSNVGIQLQETELPISSEVAGVCELLGFDPLYLANEGKLLAFVAPDQAQAVLTTMQKDPLGRNARIIGQVVADHPGRVYMETPIGGMRVVDMLTGEQLPRIC